MKAIILAGGFGTRLRPLTYSCPKPMVPILGKPIMEYVVSVLRRSRLTDCASLLYYEPEKIKDYFGNGSGFGVDMEYIIAREDLGTAGSVKNAARFVDDSVVVISGDVLTDFDLSKAIVFHKERKAAVTIILTRVEKPLAFGIVITDPVTGQIERFLEKPAWGQVFSDTINTGIYIIEPYVLEYIPEGEEFDFSKNLFPLLMSKDEPLFGYVADGYWRDVGNLREYRRANEDGIRGKVNLDKPENFHDMNGALVYVGDGCDISEDAVFEGTVFLSDGCRVENGARIVDSVIGSRSEIANMSEICGSVIWDRVKIGAGAMLDQAIVANDVIINPGATIGDHAVISEKCKIGEGAAIAASVKIWPRKTVSPYSMVNETLVWGDRIGGELFAGSRISGIINSEIFPEFASKLGAALGTSLKSKGNLLLSRDTDRASQITERALFCGIMSSGVNVEDLGIAPIPVVRWLLSQKPRSSGIHVRKSPREKNGQDIVFFNGDGTDLSTGQARAIERIFDREDFPRADYKALGTLERPRDGVNDYRRAMLSILETSAIEDANLKVVIDYSNGGAALVLPDVMSDLMVNSVSINGVVDPNRLSRTREQLESDHKRLALIVKSLGADAGFMIDPSGERLYLVDDSGRLLDEDSELCLVLSMLLELENPGSIAVPISATMGVNRIAREAGMGLSYTRDDHRAMIEAALSGDFGFVGGTRGGFIFPKWLFASDAMFAVVKIIEIMARTGIRLSDLTSNLPEYFRGRRKIECPYGSMGKVMRRLIEETAGYHRSIIDGVRIYTSDSWILVIPDTEHPLFHLIGEAKSEELLQETLSGYERKLISWRNEA